MIRRLWIRTQWMPIEYCRCQRDSRNSDTGYRKKYVEPLAPRLPILQLFFEPVSSPVVGHGLLELNEVALVPSVLIDFRW